MTAPNLDNPGGIKRQPPRLMLTEPMLTMRGITKTFGDVRALGGVDVTVYPGEVLGIVGESGSGKSTVLRMMNL
ncbi:ATP-binding cassette domain-containing protein, partial [Salmonella enterica]|uniref:ATP-binding cassette domain-containing protein n=1 Tax=Salmonella enterica TaxID=28901 RepID=UPI002666413A